MGSLAARLSAGSAGPRGVSRSSCARGASNGRSWLAGLAEVHRVSLWILSSNENGGGGWPTHFFRKRQDRLQRPRQTRFRGPYSPEERIGPARNRTARWGWGRAPRYLECSCGVPTSEMENRSTLLLIPRREQLAQLESPRPHAYLVALAPRTCSAHSYVARLFAPPLPIQNPSSQFLLANILEATQAGWKSGRWWR